MILQRLRAAFEAFRDPALVGEARGMRRTLEQLGDRNEFALLSAELIRKRGIFVPLVHMIPYEQRQAIRNYLRWSP